MAFGGAKMASVGGGTDIKSFWSSRRTTSSPNCAVWLAAGSLYYPLRTIGGPASPKIVEFPREFARSDGSPLSCDGSNSLIKPTTCTPTDGGAFILPSPASYPGEETVLQFLRKLAGSITDQTTLTNGFHKHLKFGQALGQPAQVFVANFIMRRVACVHICLPQQLKANRRRNEALPG